MASNYITGRIPFAFGEMEGITYLNLSNNQFAGILPESICSIDIDWGGANNWGVEYFNIYGNHDKHYFLSV